MGVMNQRTGVIGLEGTADTDLDVAVPGGFNRAGVQHLGAESDERTVWRWLPEAMARFTGSTGGSPVGEGTGFSGSASPATRWCGRCLRPSRASRSCQAEERGRPSSRA